MGDSGNPLVMNRGRERWIVAASLAASLGVHAAVIGFLPPFATPEVEVLAPITVTLRVLAPEPLTTVAESAPPGDERPTSAATAAHQVAAEPVEREIRAQPREHARPAPARAVQRAPHKPVTPVAPPPARIAVAPPGANGPDEQPSDPSPSAGAPVAPAIPQPLRQASALISTPPSFEARHLSNPAPVYPRRARRAGVEGTVTLKVLVTARGAPGKVEVETSSGSEALDRAAIDAVKRWQFVPARRGDAPVDAWVRVPVIFRLQSG
jgi:protein TonB